MLPFEMRNRYFEVGTLPASNRALRDAKRGISNLENRLAQRYTLLADWKVEYVGVCALLRAAIHLIQIDSKSCHSKSVTEELKREWQLIKSEKDKHAIYWEFINKERNSILKEYQWGSYKQYFDESGDPILAKDLSLLTMFGGGNTSDLRIRGGPFDGRETLEVLAEAANWVEGRISSALSRAGYSLTDRVHFMSWAKMPKPEKSLLSEMLNLETDDN